MSYTSRTMKENMYTGFKNFWHVKAGYLFPVATGLGSYHLLTQGSYAEGGLWGLLSLGTLGMAAIHNYKMGEIQNERLLNRKPQEKRSGGN